MSVIDLLPCYLACRRQMSRLSRFGSFQNRQIYLIFNDVQQSYPDSKSFALLKGKQGTQHKLILLPLFSLSQPKRPLQDKIPELL